MSAIALLGTSAWLITRASLRPPILSLAVAIACTQTFALLRGVARYGERLAVHDVSLSVLARLRVYLYDLLAPLVPGGLPGKRSGTLLSAFVQDADAVTDAMARELTATIDIAASLLLGVLGVALIDLKAATVLGAGSLLLIGTSALTGRLDRRSAQRQAVFRAELYDVVVGAVKAAPELCAFGREDLVGNAVASAEERSAAAALHSAQLTGLGRIGNVSLGCATLLGVVGVGLHAHESGRLSGVMLAVTAFISLAVLDACSPLLDALVGAANGAVASDRVVELETLVPPAPEPPHPAFPPPRPVGVALEDAVVRRQGGAPILNGASLIVPPAKRVALLGSSGAGKTTAVWTLLHFLECSSGRATLGDVDVSSLDRAALRERIGWIPDNSHIFCGSLADNLRIAKPSASTKLCVEALRRVGLGDWLASLPEGLNTEIGATGRAVSAGERQRICLARSLLCSPDVMLLDEPTAHLDPAGAASVLSELMDATTSCAVLVVCHDLDAIRDVDSVVTIEKGKTQVTS